MQDTSAFRNPVGTPNSLPYYNPQLLLRTINKEVIQALHIRHFREAHNPPRQNQGKPMT
jgi:hypothetical protein